MKILLLGISTAVSFAANSVLNRAALEANLIDPLLFSFIRIASAAAILAVILFFRQSTAISRRGNWSSAFFLVIYVFGFSIAYSFVSSATGALILFATVQFVMIGSSYRKGNRLSRKEWAGVILSGFGVLILLLPGIDRPPLIGFILMAISGFGWALFSLSGLNSKDAVRDVGQAFVKATPIAFLVVIPFFSQWHATYSGLLLALASGVFASGVGYCVWYLMLPLLTASSAAVFQLLVPVIVAILGVLLLNEEFSYRILFAGGLVVFGLGWFSRARSLKQAAR